MTTKTIVNARPVGGDYFRLINVRTSNKYLSDFLSLFNFTDYWCYKSTNLQRLVTYDDLLEFKYGGYIFFNKELYDKDHIDMWIMWCKNIGGIQYLNRPLPSFNPSKIIIRK